MMLGALIHIVRERTRSGTLRSAEFPSDDPLRREALADIAQYREVWDAIAHSNVRFFTSNQDPAPKVRRMD